MPPLDMMPDLLPELRREIDLLDDKLLDLFVRRMKLCDAVGECKIHSKAPVLQPGREQIILDKVRVKAPEPFSDDAVRLYRSILAISCARQRVMILSNAIKQKSSRIVLCGIKHCGKSVLGRRLAELLHVPFYDTDSILESAAEMPVRQLYCEKGEAEFRRIEAEAILSFSSAEPKSGVLALGGGAVSNPLLSRSALKSLGFILWLDVPVSTAFNRIEREGLPPFLSGAVDPRAEFDRICAARTAQFQEIADASASLPETLPVEGSVDRILIALEKEMCRS